VCAERVCRSRHLSTTTPRGFYTLPTIVDGAHTVRRAAEAAVVSAESALRCLTMLYGRNTQKHTGRTAGESWIILVLPQAIWLTDRTASTFNARLFRIHAPAKAFQPFIGKVSFPPPPPPLDC
jgi:hypothetical protein